MTDIRIVLIEDHDLTRMGLKVALQQVEGMTIVGEAATGQAGLRLLTAMQPDIAIIDIGLPDMDGIELVERFRQAQAEARSRDARSTDNSQDGSAEVITRYNAGSDDRNRGDRSAETKVLMLTMHDSEDAVMAAFAAGADSYCMKQTDLHDLTMAVRETYAGNSWIDPSIAGLVLHQVRNPTPETDEDLGRTVTINAVGPELEQVLAACPLTERELEILELIVAGYSNADIAERTYITVGTVKTHVRSILNKMGVDDRTKAAVRALRAGLVS